MRQLDVVIVGGGIGGSALGSALAAEGLGVEVLERTTRFEDRVRGEWIAPWGVSELKQLDLYDELRAAGGHHLSRHVTYDERVDPADAEAGALPIAALHADSPGPLCLEHVRMQEVLLERAIACGAEVRRGVTDVEVSAGVSPRVRFRHRDGAHELGCRLLVGADGRTSTVRRQLGIPLEEDPVAQLIAGLLVDGAHGWPEDLQATGKVGEMNYLVFPQGGGKVRLYADYDASDRGRFSGRDASERFLAAFDLEGVPRSDSLAKARAIGPCRSSPSQDAWTQRPAVEGAVLIGDAAGYNDPILGQGLSITLRDARLLRDLLTESADWGVSRFESYIEERAERLRRLRFAAGVISKIFARFDAAGRERRERAFRRLRSDPELMLVLAAAFIGPDGVPARLFTPETERRLFDA